MTGAEGDVVVPGTGAAGPVGGTTAWSGGVSPEEPAGRRQREGRGRGQALLPGATG
jgi:hypothetical protein